MIKEKYKQLCSNVKKIIVFGVLLIVGCSSTTEVTFQNSILEGSFEKGIQTKMLVDLGSPITIVAKSTAQENGITILDPADSIFAPALKRNAASFNGFAKKLTIGKTTIYDLNLLITEDGFFKPPIFAKVIIGFDAMQKLKKVRMSFINSTFEVLKSEIDGEKLLLEGGKLLAEISVNGKKYKAMIDSASPFSYLFSTQWNPDNYTIIKEEIKNYGGWKVNQKYYSFDIGNKKDFQIQIRDKLPGLPQKAMLLLGFDFIETLELDFVNMEIKIN